MRGRPRYWILDSRSLSVCQKDTFLSFLLSLCIALMSCYLSFNTVALSQLSIRESEML